MPIEYEYSFNSQGRIMDYEEDEMRKRMFLHIRMQDLTEIRIKTFKGEIVKLNRRGFHDSDHAEIIILPIEVADIALCKRRIKSVLTVFYGVELTTSQYIASNVIPQVYEHVQNSKCNFFEVTIDLTILEYYVIDEDEYVKTEKFVDGEDKESSCPICWAELSDGFDCAVTPCSHVFHCGCLDLWLSKRKKNGCPICRKKIRYVY